MSTEPQTDAISAEDEVVDLCRDLIRIDTSNYGDDSGPGERVAAEYVAAKLDEVGLDVAIVESEPKRASVVARIEGSDSGRGALLIHGHLDVVPAFAEDWSVDPFAGEIRDGCLWGRGAVDMKHMDAMTLAVIRSLLRDGRKPPRDVVLAFTADEEAGCRKGAHWLVDNKPEFFDGVTEAIGEVGGFSYEVGNDLRLYLIETAQRGMAWMKLTVQGRAGHGSLPNDDNAVTELCDAVTRIGRHEWPIRVTPTTARFLQEISDALGVKLDPYDLDVTLPQLGAITRAIGAMLRHSANPTMLQAGYKVNVIPGEAHAYVDGRFLPGLEDEFFAMIDELIGPKISREMVVHDIAVETDFSGALVDAMAAALHAEDAGARAIPYCMFGGTDAKAFARLGIRCFGFAPLRLPPDLDFAGMFHGVDERVPVDGLRFGTRVLGRFLESV